MLNQIVIGDETSVSHFTPQTKRFGWINQLVKTEMLTAFHKATCSSDPDTVVYLYLVS